MKIEMDFVTWLKFQNEREDGIGKMARNYLVYLRSSQAKLNEKISLEMAKEDDRETYELAMKEFKIRSEVE